ncbi:MAG: hypothetical protein AAGF26_01435 [Cyanobacteria bacterium P01_G01_bin.49]
MEDTQYQKIGEAAIQAVLITTEKFLENLLDAVGNHVSEEQLNSWWTELVRQLQPSLLLELTWSLHNVSSVLGVQSSEVGVRIS